MTGLPPNSDAVLEWGLRDTLIAYMASDREFEVETSGGATFSIEDGVRMLGRVNSDGVLVLDGGVVLRAHGGALTVPLVGVRVTGDTLTIDDPAEDPADSAHAIRERLALVRLTENPESGTGNRVYSTHLALDADSLFMFNYIPDTPFDPLRISFSPR